MSVGRVEGRVVVTGRDNASAQVDRVSGSLGRMKAQTAQATGATAALARASEHARGAVGAFGGALGAIGAVAAAGGLTALFGAMQRFAIAGEKAINVTRAAQRTLADYDGTIRRAKEATAGLVTETNLEKFSTQMTLLGVSAEQQVRMLELAAKAALSLEMEVGDVTKILADVAKGRTGRLAELGVEIDQAALAGMSGLEKLTVAVKEMDETFANVDLSDFQTSMAAGKVAAEDLESTMQAKFATVADTISRGQQVITEAMGLAADAVEVFGAALDKLTVSEEANAEASRQVAAEIEAAGGTYYWAMGRAAQLTEAVHANAEASALATAEDAARVAAQAQSRAANEAVIRSLDGVTDAQTRVRDSTSALADAQRNLDRLMQAGGASANAYALAMYRVALAQREVITAKVAKQLEEGTAAVAKAVEAAAAKPEKPRGGGGAGKPAWQYGASAGEALREMGFTGEQPAGLAELDTSLLPQRQPDYRGTGAAPSLEAAMAAVTGGATAAAVARLNDMRDAAERTAAAFEGLGEAVAGSARDLQAVAPDLGGALLAMGEGLRAMGAASTETDRIGAALDALGVVSAGLIKDVRVLAPIMIAKELALAATNWLAPWVAAEHVAAAVAWGVAAARAGTAGGAAKKSSTAASAPARAPSTAAYTQTGAGAGGGNMTINMTVQAALGAEQVAAERIERRISALRGTGMSDRRPGV